MLNGIGIKETYEVEKSYEKKIEYLPINYDFFICSFILQCSIYWKELKCEKWGAIYTEFDKNSPNFSQEEYEKYHINKGYIIT